MSDHFSGPRALAGPLCDIADVVAFPSPERSGHLVLVMNILPKATRASSFSDAIICRLRLRCAAIAATGPDAHFDVGHEEIVFDLSFDESDDGKQEGIFNSSTGDSLALRVHDPHGASIPNFRVFAGIRSDPFFMDLLALQKTVTTGQLAFTNPGAPFIPGSDVLSVVVEVNAAILPRDRDGSLFCVAAETLSAGKLPIRLERVGRPEVKNVLLNAQHGDPVNQAIDLRDLYNLEDPFHVGPDYRNAYRSRISSTSSYLDSLDGEIGWAVGEPGTHPLTELFLADFLVVDVGKPFADDGFLEIERAMLAGIPHQTCGGRTLNHDTMDTFYTLFIGGLDAPRISDGVDRPTNLAVESFPYLAEPNLLAPVPKPEPEDTVHHHHHTFGKYRL
jgi:hypothetical protein